MIEELNHIEQKTILSFMTLVPGAFGSKYYTDSILNLNCTGTEATIKECSFETGTCAQRSYNYASVICSKYSMARQSMLEFSQSYTTCVCDLGVQIF